MQIILDCQYWLCGCLCWHLWLFTTYPDVSYSDMALFFKIGIEIWKGYLYWKVFVCSKNYSGIKSHLTSFFNFRWSTNITDMEQTWINFFSVEHFSSKYQVRQTIAIPFSCEAEILSIFYSDRKRDNFSQ